MSEPEINAVTGVSGFTGKYITRRLMAMGKRVVNLTGHPERPHGFGEVVTSAPFNFDNPAELTKSLAGASTLYNTYWIRFARGEMTFDRAIENSRALIAAAKEVGVRRIVHISITNPSKDSPLPYFRGKALVEKAIDESGLSYAILRPAVLFGDEGILINNIAWFLRRLPAFAIPGSGEYRLQPIFVEDLSDLAVEYGQREENAIIDAVGPETFTMNDLVRLIKTAIGSRAFILHAPPPLSLLATTLTGLALGDVVMTLDEVKGLLANLLVSAQPPTGTTRLTDWLAHNASWLGTRYFSEVKKHY